MFERDAFDESLFLQTVETVRDLMLVRHEQRPAPLERDTDLRARETSGPIPDQPPDRAGDATVIEHKVGNGRDARGIFPFAHVRRNFIASIRPAERSCPARP